MIRPSLLALAVIAIAAVAAAGAARQAPAAPPAARNMTVMQKNQDFPVLGPITVMPCAKEDCSDTSQ